MSQAEASIDAAGAGSGASRVGRIVSFIRPYRGRIALLIVIMVWLLNRTSPQTAV